MEADAHTFDLVARLYGSNLGDYQLVSGWWGHRHDTDLPETVLPPVGVIIESDGEPCAALWCYQSFGIGVAFLEFAVTRPGLDLGHAKKSITYAVDACIAMAKASGDYCYFRCSTVPSIARHLESIGFTCDGENYKQLATRRD